jgi:hypothetical protein
MTTLSKSSRRFIALGMVSLLAACSGGTPDAPALGSAAPTATPPTQMPPVESPAMPMGDAPANPLGEDRPDPVVVAPSSPDPSSSETPAEDQPPAPGDDEPTDPGMSSAPIGNETPGGSGGAVIRVTTLALTGPGSLTQALSTPGPRIIVFEVAGIIDLARGRLDVAEPFVTIAGQSAPSPGISLIRGGMRVSTHDVRVEHVRVRMGDAGAAPASGFEPDVTTDGAGAYNIVFDHVSVAWGVDENLSVSGPRFDGPAGTSRNVVIKNSIIAEGLMNSVHEKGAHSMGSLIHDYCSDVSVVGNLFAHNNERNPWFKGFATGVIVNNLVYDPGIWAIRLGAVLNEWVDSGITPEGPRVSVVGNVMLHGVDTPTDREFIGSNSNGSAYLEDNLAFDRAGAPAAVVESTVGRLNEPPSWPEGLEPLPASSVFESVLANAGARPAERDAVDLRIVADVRARTGRIIDSQNEVGGYPSAAATRRALEVPADVEGWLQAMAAAVE